MKLLYCNECEDIVVLRSYFRTCECKSCRGRYVDDVNAIFYGPGTVIGVSNPSFSKALGMTALDVSRGRERDMGHNFDSWVMPLGCLSVKKLD